MKKAVIIYKSRTGLTKKLGWEISSMLESNNIKPTLISINDFKTEHLKDTSYLFLGCWTSGLFLFLQHPEKEWVEFAKSFPEIDNNVKVCLFTTYKLSVGSMFKNMRKYLKYNFQKALFEIKSKDGYLSDDDQEQLLSFVNS